MIELTERQREILQWIVGYIQINWRAPTMQEIADQFGVKASSAYAIVRALRKKGYLAGGDGTARSLAPINLAETSAACIDKNLLRLAQSSPSIRTVKGFDGTIRVALKHGGAGRALFTVEVRGDAMIEAGIFDGDTLIVSQQDKADDGDVVVASVGFDVMIRVVHYDDSGNVLLMGENKNLETITVALDDLIIYGKVVAVYRDID